MIKHKFNIYDWIHVNSMQNVVKRKNINTDGLFFAKKNAFIQRNWVKQSIWAGNYCSWALDGRFTPWDLPFGQSIHL